MANRTDIFLETFSQEDNDIVIMEQGIFKITPFLALASIKKKFLTGADNVLGKVTLRKQTNELKAKAVSFKEKVRAEFGIDPAKGHGDETSYKLTKEQMEVMTEIYEKYGDELVDKIVDFRRDVLAPYTLMKRTIRKNTAISSRDIHGMSKEEYMSALESGKRKIDLRGKYIHSGDDSFEKIEDVEVKLQKLREAKNSLKEKGHIDDNIIEKLYAKFNVQKDTFSRYSLKNLESYTASLNRTLNTINSKNRRDVDASDDIDKYTSIKNDPDRFFADKEKDVDRNSSAQERAIDIYFGKIKRIIAPHNNFNEALTSFFLRKNIHDTIKENSASVYRDIYFDIIDGMIHKYENIKKEHFNSTLKNRKDIYFNDLEEKIFKLKSGAPFMSGKMEDYDIKIQETDFLERPIYIKKSHELEVAEKKADDEIKRFEAELKEIMEPEDYSKLRKYRLIGNLITVREMRNPNDIFKSSTEIRNDISSKDDGDDEDFRDPEKKLTEDDFKELLNKIITKDYSSLSELLSDKRKLESMIKGIRLNNQDRFLLDNRSIIEKARARKEVKEDDDKKETNGSSIVSYEDIEDFVSKILEKNYNSFNDLKDDREKLKEMERNFKNSNPDSKKVDEVEFMVQKAGYKFKKYAFGIEGGID